MVAPVKHSLICAAAVVASVGLAGCAAASTPVATPTVTLTTTVTATPSPTTTDRSATDAVTSLDAWLLCYGATFGVYSETSRLFPYSGNADAVTDNGDGTFSVRVPFAPLSGEGVGAESLCVAGGTLAEPTIELQGGRDFG